MPPRVRQLLPLLLLALCAGLLSTPWASARVLSFSGAERSLGADWASWSCAHRSRVKEVSSPVAQGSRAYEVEVKDGDNSWGERCEIGMGNPARHGFPLFHEGDERWISFQVYLPDDYPLDTHLWNVFFQIHQRADGGCPPIALHAEDGRWRMENTTRNTYVLRTRPIWEAPAQRNRWAKFTLHIKNSTDDRVGFVELYGDLDGQGVKPLLERTYTHTMTKYANGRAMTNHARVGIYRNPKIRGDAHILFDGFTIATDRASAERAAFDDPAPVLPVGARPRPRVWLRLSDRGLRTAGSRQRRVVRVHGGVRPGRGAAGRRVTIQIRKRSRWEWLARGRVRRDGRFYVGAAVDPSITSWPIELRAAVAGVGHSGARTLRL